MGSFGVVSARIYGWLNRFSTHNRVVVDLASLGEEDRVLEIGCGPGTAVAYAAERIGADRVSAVDPSPTFVGMVRKRVPGADIRVAGAEDLPFDDASFSAILAIASMHHWSDRAAGLTTATRKLAPDGRLLIAERLLKRQGHGITPEQIDEVTSRLSDLGYRDVHTVERRIGRKAMAILRATR